MIKRTYPIYSISKFSFNLDDGSEVLAIFRENLEYKGQFDFIYSVNENVLQDKIVPYSIYSRILATLSNIIQDFIHDKYPITIFLKSNPRKEGLSNDRAKHNIHGQCLKMQIYKIPEYDYCEAVDGWLIYRKEVR